MILLLTRALYFCIEVGLGIATKAGRKRSKPLIAELATILKSLIGTLAAGPDVLCKKIRALTLPNLDRHQSTCASQKSINAAETAGDQLFMRRALSADAGATRLERIRASFIRTAAASGLAEATCPKSWRHTFATLLQDANLHPLIRQITLGHAPPSMFGGGSLGMTAQAEGQTPSIAAIKERLVLEERLEELQQLEQRFAEIIARFAPLAADWAQVQSQLRSIITDVTTEDDARKIDHLEGSVREQLSEYGFSSFPVERITISRENFRPSREGYEIGVTSVTSASDYIRILWAYLVGLLELARRQRTNHLNLLILDEPKQQSANRVSFDALLRRASESGRFGQQVIFATSEEYELLEPAIGSIDCNVIEFNDKMLRRADI